MIYRFGGFSLDTDRLELTAHGRSVEVEPQVFGVLRLLVENNNRVVSKDELIEAVWGGRIVSDATLDSRISAARKAVGDSGKNQRVIKTLARRGFRFVAPLDETPADTPTGRAKQSVRFCTSADGTNIAYAELGSGPPLVRAGTWLTHLEQDWAGPIWGAALEGLGRHFTVFRHDQRGNGLSDWDVADLTLDHFVADLEAMVDAAGLDRFTLFGQSQGAPISIAYAARHPERVANLILLGGFAVGRQLRASDSERDSAQALATLIRNGWGQAGGQFLEAFASIFIPDGTPEQIHWLAEMQRATTNGDNAYRLRQAFDVIDVTDMLDRVQARTLVIHAQNDAVHPLDQGRLLAARIPDARFVVLDARNHIIVPPDPAWETFMAEVTAFVAADAT